MISINEPSVSKIQYRKLINLIADIKLSKSLKNLPTASHTRRPHRGNFVKQHLVGYYISIHDISNGI